MKKRGPGRPPKSRLEKQSYRVMVRMAPPEGKLLEVDARKRPDKSRAGVLLDSWRTVRKGAGK